MGSQTDTEVFHVECLLHCWSEGLCPVCGTSFAPEVSAVSSLRADVCGKILIPKNMIPFLP